MKVKLRKPGDFLKLKARHKNRQRVYDGCKRARSGEAEVFVTLKRFIPAGYKAELVRAKLAPIDPKSLDCADYAHQYGAAAVLMVHGEPMLCDLSGKDGVVYGPTGQIDSLTFLNKALALVTRGEDIHARGSPVA